MRDNYVVTAGLLNSGEEEPAQEPVTPDVEAAVETEPEAEPGAGPEADAEPETEPEADAESETEPEAGAAGRSRGRSSEGSGHQGWSSSGRGAAGGRRGISAGRARWGLPEGGGRPRTLPSRAGTPGPRISGATVGSESWRGQRSGCPAELGVRRRGWRGPPPGQAEGGPGPSSQLLGAGGADPGTLPFDGGGGGPGAAPNLGGPRGVRGQLASAE